MAGKRELTNTQPQWRSTTNTKSMQRIMIAATKRVRATRTMATIMRVQGNKEGKGSKGHGIGNKDGMQQRGQWQW